jgi:hypothetical protein
VHQDSASIGLRVPFLKETHIRRKLTGNRFELTKRRCSIVSMIRYATSSSISTIRVSRRKSEIRRLSYELPRIILWAERP